MVDNTWLLWRGLGFEYCVCHWWVIFLIICLIVMS